MPEPFDTLFWNLVSASRDAAFLALAVGGLLLLLGNRLTAGWRHALWMLVAVRLVIPVLPVSPMSWQRLLPEFTPDVREETAAPVTIADPASREVGSTSTRPSIASPATSPPLTNPGSPVPGAVPREWKSDAIQPADDPPPPPPGRSLSLGVGLAIAWAAGAMIFLVIMGTLTARFRRRVRRLATTPARLSEIRTLLFELARKSGFRRLPHVRVTGAVTSPALTGPFRPTLLLPPAVADDLPTDLLRLILLHELGHLRRGDLWTNWLLSILQAVHWFNPLVWWAFRRTRIEAERACDAWVLSRAGAERREDYGQTLIHLMKSSRESAAIPGVLGVIESRRDLRRRIALIGRFTGKRRRIAIAGAATLLASLAAVGLTQAPAEWDDDAAAEDSRKVVIRTVMRESGAPVPGVEIALATNPPDDDDAANWAGKTGSNGEAEFRIPKEHTTLKASVSKDGLAPLWTWVKPPKTFTFRMDVAGEIGGTVFDSNGRPIEGATIDPGWSLHQPEVAREDYQWPDDDPESPIVTDANGNWSFGPVPVDARLRDDPERAENPLYLSISVSHECHVPADFKHHREATFEKLHRQSSRIILAPAFPITGRFTDPSGQPIGDVLVRQLLGHGRDSPRARSVGDGNFVLYLQPGVSRILIAKAGFATTTQTIRVPAKPEGLNLEEVTLKPVAPLRIRITDSDGNPVSEARFTAMEKWGQVRYSEPYRLADYHTDENGIAVWESPPLKRGWIFTASKRGYRALRDAAGPTPESEDLEVTLTREIRVSGSITDAATGKPVTRFRISRGETRPDGTVFWQRPDRILRSDAGHYFYALDEKRETRFRIEAEGYLSGISRDYDQTGSKRQFTENFTLQPQAAQKTFRVLEPDGEAPANGARLLLLGRNNGLAIKNLDTRWAGNTESELLQADERGWLTFPETGSGGRGWIVSEKGYRRIDEEQAASLNGNDPFHLEAFATGEGTFKVNGMPAAGWELQFSAPIPVPGLGEGKHDWWILNEETDQSGVFRTNRLVPREKPYQIHFIDPISGEKSGEMIGQITAEIGKVNRTEIDYDAESRVNVRGRFVDGDGESLAESGLVIANISLRPTMGREFHFYIRPEKDGTFLTVPIRPGHYQLVGDFSFRSRPGVRFQKEDWLVPANAVEKAEAGIYDAGDIWIEKPKVAPAATADPLPDGAVAVRIVDEKGGTPVAGATVTPWGIFTAGGSELGWRDGQDSPDPEPLVTDQSGAGAIRYPVRSTSNHARLTGDDEVVAIRLRVEHPDFLSIGRIRHPIDGSAEPVRLETGAALRVSGRLADSGKAVTDSMMVQVTDVLRTFKNDAWEWEPGDGGGDEPRWRIHRVVSPGERLVRVAHRDENGRLSFSESALVKLEKGGTAEHRVELKPALEFFGKLDSAVPRPVRNGTVTAMVAPRDANWDSLYGALRWTATAEVEADGSFRFQNLPPGEIRVAAQCDGWAQVIDDPRHRSSTLQEIRSDRDQPAIVRMRKMGACRVRLKKPDGSPLPEAEVAFFPNQQWPGIGSTIAGRGCYQTEWGIGSERDLEAVEKFGEQVRQSFAGWSGQTDASGFVTIGGLPFSGPQIFRIEHPDFQIAEDIHGQRFGRVELTSGETVEVVMTLEERTQDK